MATLKKYTLSGTEAGEIQLPDSFLDVEAHSQMIKDYIIALRANSRQWSANTRGRSEVKHTTKKPHRQKGTGGARQGSLVTPQYRGGGIVFGPKPKFNQHVRINRKERRLALHAILVDKIKENKILVMEDKAFGAALKRPQTSLVAGFLKQHELFGRRVLFVGEGESDHQTFKLSMRNIPRTFYSLALNLNGYDMVAARTLVMTESALNELTQFFKG